MTDLLSILKSRIQARGPLSLAEYMTEALGNRQYGYYRNANPIGKTGDFITAPEISQMFGELLGLWFAVCWQQMGSPNSFNLIELGPGRGTLMCDALRATTNAPLFKEALNIRMVETSPVLGNQQRVNLSSFSGPCTWHQSVEDVPEGQFILIANEFLDTLPLHQFLYTESGWCERLISFDEENSCLQWTLSTPNASGEIIDISLDLDGSLGMILEVSPRVQKLVETVSMTILKSGGTALFIDYGYVEQKGGDTFQGVKNHKYADPLAFPGSTDLTAHVDFEAIKRTAEDNGVTVTGPITQGKFLCGLGIKQRAEQLAANASLQQKRDIFQSLGRLIDDDKMGELFKVLALSHPDNPIPEGFADG